MEMTEERMQQIQAAQRGAFEDAGKIGMEKMVGSGERAMEDNRKKREELEAEMESLRNRAAAGEIVDEKVRTIQKRMRMIQEDAGRINEGGL